MTQVFSCPPRVTPSMVPMVRPPPRPCERGVSWAQLESVSLRESPFRCVAQPVAGPCQHGPVSTLFDVALWRAKGPRVRFEAAPLVHRQAPRRSGFGDLRVLHGEGR